MSGVKSAGEMLECICPKCGVEHNLRIFWTGKTKPKKFCKECKGVAERTPGEIIHKIHKSGRRRSLIYEGKKELYLL